MHYNLIWNRGLIKGLFDFEYVWEVYKPKTQRKYGYYVLPILYGDRFIARFEPRFDKKERIFTVENWWWEEGVKLDVNLESALKTCLKDFISYLSADSIQLGKSVRNISPLQWLEEMIEH